MRYHFMQPYKLSKTSVKTFTFSALNVGTYEGGNNIRGLHLMKGNHHCMIDICYNNHTKKWHGYMQFADFAKNILRLTIKLG